jgi:acyl carrier protein
VLGAIIGPTAEKLGISESAIKENSLFKDDLGADSLDLYELFMAIEKQFGIIISEEQAEKIAAPGGLCFVD